MKKIMIYACVCTCVRAFSSFGGVCMLLYVCASVCVLSTQSARGGIVQLKRRASNRSGTSRGVAPEKAIQVERKLSGGVYRAVTFLASKVFNSRRQSSSQVARVLSESCSKSTEKREFGVKEIYIRGSDSPMYFANEKNNHNSKHI